MEICRLFEKKISIVNEAIRKDLHLYALNQEVVRVTALSEKKASYKGIESKHTEGRNRKDISGEIRLSKDTVKRKA